MSSQLINRINEGYAMQKKLTQGLKVLSKEGKARLEAVNAASSGPFTWNAKVTPLSSLSTEELKKYTGFNPTLTDIMKTHYHQKNMKHPHSTGSTTRAGMSMLNRTFNTRSGASNQFEHVNVTNFLHHTHNPHKSTYVSGHTSMSGYDLAQLRKMTGYTPSSADVMRQNTYNRAGFSSCQSLTQATNQYVAPSSIPDSFDWRTVAGECIGPVSNQGSCGSCWAVSSAGAGSDRQCIACKKNGHACYVEFSPETLVACAVSNGCGGSQLDVPYQYMMGNGIPPLSSVPYTSGPGTVPSCSSVTNQAQGMPLLKASPLTTTGFGGDFTIPSQGDVITSMKREIMQNGPITAGMTVFKDFANYRGGVYQPMSYKVLGSNPVVGGHALELIGWGNEDGMDYWLVKNSWGTEWGLDGYFKMKMYPPGQQLTIGDIAGPDAQNASTPVMTFEATAHAAMFDCMKNNSNFNPNPSNNTYPSNYQPQSNPSSIYNPSNPLGPMGPV